MAVQAWRWDPGGEMVAELQRGEGELGAAVAQGLGQQIDDLLLAVGCGGLRDALQGEWRAGGRTQ
jgi:hypothetical protein